MGLAFLFCLNAAHGIVRHARKSVEAAGVSTYKASHSPPKSDGAPVGENYGFINFSLDNEIFFSYIVCE